MHVYVCMHEQRHARVLPFACAGAHNQASICVCSQYIPFTVSTCPGMQRRLCARDMYRVHVVIKVRAVHQRVFLLTYLFMYMYVCVVGLCAPCACVCVCVKYL
jgi:hypothetical protein